MKAGNGSRQGVEGSLKLRKAIIKTSILFFNSDKSEIRKILIPCKNSINFTSRNEY
jgi:hypothetical protein